MPSPSRGNIVKPRACEDSHYSFRALIELFSNKLVSISRCRDGTSVFHFCKSGSPSPSLSCLRKGIELRLDGWRSTKILLDPHSKKPFSERWRDEIIESDTEPLPISSRLLSQSVARKSGNFIRCCRCCGSIKCARWAPLCWPWSQQNWDRSEVRMPRGNYARFFFTLFKWLWSNVNSTPLLPEGMHRGDERGAERWRDSGYVLRHHHRSYSWIYAGRWRRWLGSSG